MTSANVTSVSHHSESVRNSMLAIDRVAVGGPEDAAADAGGSGSGRGHERTGQQEMRRGQNGGRREMVSMRRSASQSDQLPLSDGHMQQVPAAATAAWSSADGGPVRSSLLEEQNADQERSRSPRAKSDVVHYTEDSRYR